MADGPPTPATFPELVAWRAAHQGAATFLQEVGTGREWTYAEVHDGGLRWASAYRALGVTARDTVVTMLPTRGEYLLSWLGLSWLRAIEVPTNTQYRGAMLEHVLNNSGARVFVVAEEFLDQVLPSLAQLTALECILVLGPGGADFERLRREAGSSRVESCEEVVAAAEPLADVSVPGLHEIGCVLYTSGTTGASKGVLQPWGQIRSNAIKPWPLDALREGEAAYLVTPNYHQAGKIIPYLAAEYGARVVLREKFSVTDFWSEVNKFGCTVTTLIGVMAPFIANQAPRPDDADNILRWVMCIPILADIDSFKARFGVEVCTVYGMTEIPVPFSSIGYEVTNANASSCGKLVDGVEVRLVDELDYPVRPGEVGELILRCDRPWEINQGYLGMPEATVAAWRNGWFHTGDAFREGPDGLFYFVDRLKDAIRRRGENISSLEVESIVNRHPQIVASAAVAVPAQYSEDEIKISVVRQPGSSLETHELIAFLEPLMPPFMIPRYIDFLDELPKTTTERVQKAELRATGVTATTWDRLAVKG